MNAPIVLPGPTLAEGLAFLFANHVTTEGVPADVRSAHP